MKSGKRSGGCDSAMKAAPLLLFNIGPEFGYAARQVVRLARFSDIRIQQGGHIKNGIQPQGVTRAARKGRKPVGQAIEIGRAHV